MEYIKLASALIVFGGILYVIYDVITHKSSKHTH